MARVRGSQIYSQDTVTELKAAMAAESSPDEDDDSAFRLKVNALQRFLNHGMARFSIERWHHALLSLVHTSSRAGVQHSSSADTATPVVTKLRGVGDLRLLSRDVMLQQERGSTREEDVQALRYLDHFLTALQYLKEAKACITAIYSFLYRYYYDPDAGRENSHIHSATSLSRSSTLQPAGSSSGEGRPFEESAQQFGILTQQQMRGSAGHKLRRTVTDMQRIMARWEQLLTEDEIQLEDLDAESQHDLQLLSGTGAFQSVLRLLPDMFAKYYKCLELLKQWWVLAHDIYPQLPINRPPTPTVRGSPEGSADGARSRTDSGWSLSPPNEKAEDKVLVSDQLLKVGETIQVKTDLIQSLEDELKVLEERDRHFESLVEAHDKVTAELEEQTRRRKELAAVREKETFPSNNQVVSQTTDHRELSAKNSQGREDDVSVLLASTERAVQLLQFQQTLLRQDYMLQLEVRPSLIRFAEDLRIRLAEAQQSLTEDKTEKEKLERLLQEENSSDRDTGLRGQPHLKQPTNSNDLHPLQSPETSKAAERKLELSRLHAKPHRLDTPDSSFNTATDTHLLSNAGTKTEKKCLKAEDTDPQTAESQSTTEPLFRRRARQPGGSEAPEERKTCGQPAARPRAKSDQHAGQPDRKAARLNPQPQRRLSVADPGKKTGKEPVTRPGPALSPNPSPPRQDRFRPLGSDLNSHPSKAAGSKDSNISTKTRKSDDSSHQQAAGHSKDGKAAVAGRNSDPDDISEDKWRSFKASDGRKASDVTPADSKVGKSTRHHAGKVSDKTAAEYTKKRNVVPSQSPTEGKARREVTVPEDKEASVDGRSSYRASKGEAKQDAKVSQNSKSASRSAADKTPQIQGATTKPKKHNYANV